MAVTVTALSPGTRVLRSATPKRGLRGAFMNIPYVGPAKVAAADHAVSADLGGGGAEDSKGYRKSDTYDPSGNTGGLPGGPATSVTRPSRYRNGPGATTVQAYIGAGIQGGSAPGSPIDATGRAVDTGVDRFGRTMGPGTAAGIQRYTYTNFDGRATLDGDGGRALGQGGRGTQEAAGTVTTVDPPGAAPTFGAVADGVIAVADLTGGAGVSVNVAAADLSGSDRAGAEIAVFKRGTDTDEDGALVFFGSVTGTTGATAIPNTNVAGVTYAIYARFLSAGEAPRSTAGGAAADTRVRAASAWSARTTVTTT